MTKFILDETKFDEMQLDIIKGCYDAGFDPSSFADPKYDWAKMQVAAHGIREGFNLSNYLNDFSHSQLDLIRLGLKQGLNVELLAKPEFSFEEMHHKLLSLSYERGKKE
jgi:hypothetical protein